MSMRMRVTSSGRIPASARRWLMMSSPLKVKTVLVFAFMVVNNWVSGWK